LGDGRKYTHKLYERHAAGTSFAASYEWQYYFRGPPTSFLYWFTTYGGENRHGSPSEGLVCSSRCFISFSYFALNAQQESKTEKNYTTILKLHKIEKRTYTLLIYVYAYLLFFIRLKILMNRRLPIKTHFTI